MQAFALVAGNTVSDPESNSTLLLNTPVPYEAED